MIHTRLGCSTISFRHLDLDAAGVDKVVAAFAAFFAKSAVAAD